MMVNWKPVIVIPEEKKQLKRAQRAADLLREPLIKAWEAIKRIFYKDEAKEALIEQHNKMSWEKCKKCRFLQMYTPGDKNSYPIFICGVTGNQLELINCIKGPSV